MRQVSKRLVIVVVATWGLLAGCGASRAESPAQANPATASSSPTTAPTGQTNLLAMGDWGEDTAAQRQVAAAMARYVKADSNPFTALLLLGDNFYFKLTGVNDPRWQSVFERVYDPKTLSMPFYA